MAVITSGSIREVRFPLLRDKTLSSPSTVGGSLECLRPLFAGPYFKMRDEVNCPLLCFCGVGVFWGGAAGDVVGFFCLFHLLLYFDPVCENRLC